MVAGSLETVLIGNPVDGDDDTIGRSVRVRSLGDGTNILGFRSNFFLASTFLDLGSVSALETVKSGAIIEKDYKQQILFDKNLRIAVASVRVHFAVG